jgi:hypothetical protein
MYSLVNCSAISHKLIRSNFVHMAGELMVLNVEQLVSLLTCLLSLVARIAPGSPRSTPSNISLALEFCPTALLQGHCILHLSLLAHGHHLRALL